MIADHPVSTVRWVPIDKVHPNEWNPNQVAPRDMELLLISLLADGFTQPVVTFQDGDSYEVVDGFHRYYLAKTDPELRRRCEDQLPIVVIDKPISERMASTVRHNRARGVHVVDGMADLIFAMKRNGRSDTEICAELGLSAEEFTRLTYVSGYAALWKDHRLNRSWKSIGMIQSERNYAESVHSE